MLMPGTSSSNSATMLPRMTTPRNFSDSTSARNGRQRAARWVARIVRALDHFGYVVEEDARDQRADRCDQQG
jgi:hypothetical protein